MKIHHLFILFALAFIACQDEQPSPKEISSEVLHQPPFAGITDSIEQDPGNVELRLTRGLMLAQKNLHELATPDFEMAWNKTKDASIGLEYASNLLLSGQEAKAIQFLEGGIKQFPDNPNYERRLAEVYQQTGDNTKALEVYKDLVQKDSSDFEGWYNLGALQAETGDTLQAIRSLERSYSIVPLNLSGLLLANIYINKKDSRALPLIDHVIARDSAQMLTDALFLKGAYYAEMNQPQKAIEQFDEVIKRDWKITDAHIEKGIIYLKQKDFNKALEIFRMASTVSNTDADPYYWIGRTYEAQKNFPSAIENYERALSLDPDFIEARQRMNRIK